MKECMVVNVASVVGGSVAIGIACYVTKTAWPLWAFLIIPKWDYDHHSNDKKEAPENE